MAEEGKTKYLIEFTNGTKKRITVPSSWKVTFGPVAVPKDKTAPRSYQDKIPLALRFYESDTKQRAIFTNVASFRDLSIEVEEERVKTQAKDGFIEVDGSRKATTIKTEVREWVNPDDIDNSNEPAKIIHDADVMDLDMTE